MAFPIQRLRRLRHHEATIQRKVFYFTPTIHVPLRTTQAEPIAPTPRNKPAH